MIALGMLDNYSFFFVTPKTHFVQLQICIFVTDHGSVIYSNGVLSASLYSIPDHPIPLLFCAASPLPKASAIRPGLYFSSLCHYLINIKISFCIEKNCSSLLCL